MHTMIRAGACCLPEFEHITAAAARAGVRRKNVDREKTHDRGDARSKAAKSRFTGSKTRRSHYRCRGGRALPVAPAPRAGDERTRLRHSLERRRHMVLESLPWCQVRLRGLHLPIPVFRRAIQRLELEREIPWTVGDRTLAELCH